MLCAKSVWNWQSGSGEEDFLISSMYFHYFVIISPWNSAGSFIWTSLHPYHLRMLCAKFGWYWPSGYLKFVNVFWLFHYYPPLEKGWPSFIWKNLSPHHPRMFCAKFGWNFRRRILKCKKFTGSLELKRGSNCLLPNALQQLWVSQVLAWRWP